MRPAGSLQALQRRRERAMWLLDEGREPHEVASMLKVDRHSPKALQAKPLPGRSSKLSDWDKAELEKLLLDGAQAAGFPTDLWTCRQVAQAIEERFGVRCHVDYVGCLMHGMGWSPQKPTRRALERDEEGISNWVRGGCPG